MDPDDPKKKVFEKRKKELSVPTGAPFQPLLLAIISIS
jgi:hypothetical protein